MNTMKKRRQKPDVTIVATSKVGWHQEELRKALSKHGLNADCRDFDATISTSEQIKDMGDIIIWRSSSLSHGVQRPALRGFTEDSFFINQAIFEFPQVAQKYFQQQIIKSVPSLKHLAIETFLFKTTESFKLAVQSGALKLPVIAKPNLGSRGEGIELIQKAADLSMLPLSIQDYVFQSYIPNSGDWRVIVVGGRAIGVMKRVAREGSYLNNVSRGATAIPEKDSAVVQALYDIAAKTAAVFKLRFCGVDIIRDEKTGNYMILEVNTAPQWSGEYGFTAVTGVDVADEVAKYVRAIKNRMLTKNVSDLVDEYYRSNILEHMTEATHYASRLWLWSQDEWARDQLDRTKDEFIGSTPKHHREIVTNILDRANRPLSVNQEKAYRKAYFEKYRKLPMYNALLFKVLFAETIYQVDLRPYIAEHINDTEFVQYFDALVKDEHAIRVLSTHAINYFYLLKFYFKNKINLSSMVLVDPYELLEISRGYGSQIESGELSKPNAIKLRIYLLTHAIIGESQFYYRQVKSKSFLPLIKELEQIIYDDYADISLDNKCEFLVCAKLCGYETRLAAIIASEASQSLSWSGNFIVERNAPLVRHTLRTSEHRNVLYVMSNTPRKAPGDARGKTTRSMGERSVIGRLARVSVPELGLDRLIARVDSGATWSSLCVSGLLEDSSGLRFTLLYPEHPLYTGEVIYLKPENYRTLSVSSASAQQHERYAIQTDVTVNGLKRRVNCTLTDRKHMMYPILLGRDFLKGQYVVDVSRQFVRAKRKGATK